MNKAELENQVKELEARVARLEARPVYIPQPYPVYPEPYPAPYFPPHYQGPWWEATAGDAVTISSDAISAG